MAEVAAKEVAALNEVAEVEAMPNEVEVEELAAAGSSAVAVREVVGADSVADSHLGSRQAARNAAMPARRHSVVVPADLVLGRVPGREAQDEQVSALVAQVSQVLERAARDAQESVRVALENRVQPPELRHRIVIILSTPAAQAPPQVLLLPIVTIAQYSGAQGAAAGAAASDRNRPQYSAAQVGRALARRWLRCSAIGDRSRR